MEPSSALERKAFFVEPKALRSARRILRARSDGETVRIALARVKEIEESWKPLLKLAGAAKGKSFCDVYPLEATTKLRYSPEATTRLGCTHVTPAKAGA